MRIGILLLGLMLAGCGDGGGSGSSETGSIPMDFSVSTTPTNSLLSVPFMGRTKVMIGFSDGQSSTGNNAPFDLEYRYLNSSAWDAAYNHANCLSGTGACKSGWYSWNLPAGQYAKYLVDGAKARTWNGVTRAQIPFFTYFMLPSASGLPAGSGITQETSALDDQTFMTNYFDDWRWLLQKIGSDQAMLHIEPDLFGFLKGRADAAAAPHTGLPSAIPAKVTTSSRTDCTDVNVYPNDASGYVKCMIHMVRVYAPQATVGIHVSPWTYTSPGDATSWANFINALGAGQGDFLVADPSDRDAGYCLTHCPGNTDWDVAKMTTFFQWTNAVSSAVGNLPFFLWQVPLGNSYQNNTDYHYQDHRLELLFSHMQEVRDAHIAGVLFGSGETVQTNMSTDGGLLVGKTKQHYISRGSVD